MQPMNAGLLRELAVCARLDSLKPPQVVSSLRLGFFFFFFFRFLPPPEREYKGGVFSSLQMDFFEGQEAQPEVEAPQEVRFVARLGLGRITQGLFSLPGTSAQVFRALLYLTLFSPALPLPTSSLHLCARPAGGCAAGTASGGLPGASKVQ